MPRPSTRTVPHVSTPFTRVLYACRQMESAGGPVDVDELAQAIPCSTRQLQRDFQTVIGTSPNAYGQAVRATTSKRALRTNVRVSDAIEAAGYGSVRAFYEQAAARLGMEPRVYAKGAAQQVLLWSITPTAIGQVMVVASIDGLCALRIGHDEATLIDEGLAEFPKAELIRDDAAMRDVMRAMRAIALGDQIADLPTDVVGTAFQAKVWDALRTIPSGETRSYAEIARKIRKPKAARAVASACASNPVALVVPCHRVIHSDGSISGYAWGVEVKEALLDAEGAQYRA